MSNSASQLMPFVFTAYSNKFVSTFEFYGDYAFAGLSNSGLVIRSKNRYSWEKFYQTVDTNISALKAYNGYLYIGTSPSGNIYRINMSTLSVENFGSMGSEIVDFVVFNEELYVAINGPQTIMKMNLLAGNFDFFYTPYALINKMRVFGDKIYIVLEASNVVTFDGVGWNKIIMGNDVTNVSSFRNVSKEVSLAFGPNTPSEALLNSFPINHANGVKSIAQDGTSIIIGSSNYTRLYRLLDNDFNMIFNTEGLSVDDILNIKVGTNLIASGNKVYLVYSGKVDAPQASNAASAITTTTTTIDPNAGKSIVVTYPNGGELIQSGDNINIQWSSTKGINDAIKIELLKGSTVNMVINSQTSNTGAYEWYVPLALPIGSDYKIRITWLSAGTVDPSSIDESNGYFNIGIIPAVTTTTTTAIVNPQKPDTSSTRGIPILELPPFESVVKLVNDDETGSVLISTSNGRILSCSKVTINGFMTGERLVYADAYDGCGYIGEAQTVFNYSLYKKIAEIDENKVIKQWKFSNPFSATKSENIVAIFQGPIVNITNDFGFWKEVIWEETKPIGSNVTIYLRAGTSEEELLKAPWIYSTTSEGETSPITRSLNNVGLNGQYIQVKVEMETTVKDITPSVTNVTVKYSSKNSSYFFTNKFTIDLDNAAQKGLLTANVSQPVNTEIQFGITDKNTADWTQYQVITPDKMFDINNKEMKIGIKFTSYDASLPVVSEFALMVGGETLKELNS